MSPDRDRDGTYDAIARCYWVIEAQDHKYIEFQVLFVDIKFSDECLFDELVVRESPVCFSGSAVMSLQASVGCQPSASSFSKEIYSNAMKPFVTKFHPWRRFRQE